ncbi:MAG: outer membrane lipoprotein carrier protein LolA [Rhodothermales bacterium]
MFVRRFLARFALIAATVLTVGHPVAHAQDADTIFDRLLAKYHAIDGIRAEFTQTMSSTYLDQDESFTGVLILQGEKYRIETGTEVLVVNGTETYVFRPNENQLLINDVVEDDASFSPTDFLLRHDERFNIIGTSVDHLDGQKHYKLSLQPKNSDSFFREATLWMRDLDDIITRLQVIDVNETKMLFTLQNIELNPTLDAETFTITPPDGVEVIDLRSE